MSQTISQPTGEQVEKIDVSVPGEDPAQNAIVDEDLSEFGIPPLPEGAKDEDDEEEKVLESEPKGEEGKQSDDSEELKNAPEKGVSVPEPSTQEPAQPQVKEYVPSSIDQRIAQLYTQATVLNGDEVPGAEVIFESLKGRSFREKEKALHYWLDTIQQLRGVTNPEPISAEDTNILVEARSAEILEQREREVEREVWNRDLIDTVNANKALDESSKEYDPSIAIPVSKMIDSGMKASEAYAIVTGLITQKAEKEEKKKEEEKKIAEQVALSGMVSTGSKTGSTGGKMTWDEFDSLRDSDPERYDKLNELRIAGKLELLGDEDD